MDCRICESMSTKRAGVFRAYLDYKVEIYDCVRCGCRFSAREEKTYENLHSCADSTYGTHNNLALAVKKHYDARNTESLEAVLCRQKKNQFIIEAAKKLKPNSKVLEVGCSLGYLTSWFVAKGFDVTGTDISKTAIAKASKLFGPHFTVASDDKVRNQAPYDLICHAGTIGCVDDPLELTRYWLMLLKPGGQLIFNAPNKSLADKLNKLWPHTTPPPDLVTLFPVRFWSDHFNDLADVDVAEDFLTNREVFIFKTLPRSFISCRPYLYKKAGALSFLCRAVLFVTRKLMCLIHDNSASRYPSEFGVMVILTKRLHKP